MSPAETKPPVEGHATGETVSWLDSYVGGEGYDEALCPEGEWRPAYRGLISELNELSAVELKRRSEAAQRIIHEQGITYNVYGDPRGMDRPWSLDPLPMVLGADEWRGIERGLKQRASLLNEVLADAYGAQRMIRASRFPSALVYAQPDFLRPCHEVRPAQGLFLHMYAADIARAADGRWWVISDRTQIPTGAGYALANRLVTSRVLPEAFRACRVHRLAPFFRAFRALLASLSPRPTEDPRIVLLTPGPYNETYFEQAWLARYLGFALVEGQDLAVRDGRVWLKTLSGLEPVDVILRRVDDDWCDPLELRNDSTLGVPGLLEAWRAGAVAIANSPGSGLVQSPALMPFLPGLCRELLGEDLEMPSVATWWCGQKQELEHVLKHADRLAIRPAFRGAVKLPDLAGGEPALEELRRRIAFQPHSFVAQENIELSSAPSWDGAGVSAHPVALRVYLVAGKDGYVAMPGGLTRVAPDTEGRFISMQRGGASKDTWVLAEGPIDEVSLLQSASQSVELRRVGNNLPSRLADDFFWLGRYCDRADSTARLLRSALVRFSPESTGSAMPLLEPLLNALAAQGQIASLEERPELRTSPEALEAELLAAIFDPERRGSLRRIADQLAHIAMQVRDRTSNDLWRVLSTVDDRVTLPPGSPVILAGDAVGVLNQTILGLASFHGLARENMTRAQGWRFLDMGVRIERCIHTAAFLDAALRCGEANNPSVLEAVLEVLDSAITYRSRYNLLPNLAAVFDLVMLDDTNPRSLVFQLNQLLKHIDRLPRERDEALPSPASRVLLECATRVRLADPRPLVQMEESWHESEVGRVLALVLRDMPRLSDAIAVSYFAHTTTSRAGGGGRR
ncbi:MAG: circularly permuted type 2 ATP-grasp protein [Verrucomicrobiales bacterium]|nr:circularly permuted type 2 ATP-grasp protein [Verrucomicrobiales bacterium]